MECVVAGCNSRRSQAGVTWHLIPDDPNERQTLINFCRLGEEWEPQRTDRICSRHLASPNASAVDALLSSTGQTLKKRKGSEKSDNKGRKKQAVKKPRKVSDVHAHFTTLADGRRKCNYCEPDQVFYSGNSSMSTLRYHLRHNHEEVLDNVQGERKFRSIALSFVFC